MYIRVLVCSCEVDKPVIHVYDGRGEDKEIACLDKVHSSAITFMEVPLLTMKHSVATNLCLCFSLSVSVSLSLSLSLCQYNHHYDIVVSGDESGMVEYWSGPANDYVFPKNIKFEHKIDTDLYDFAKVG